MISQKGTPPDKIIAESGINDVSEKGFYSILELIEGPKELQRGSLESERRTETHNELSKDRSGTDLNQSYMTSILGRVVAGRWENMSLELTQAGTVGGLIFLLGVALYILYNISHVYTTMKEWSRKVTFKPAEVVSRSYGHTVEMDDHDQDVDMK